MRSFFAWGFMLFTAGISAQNWCATAGAMEALFDRDPALRAKYNAARSASALQSKQFSENVSMAKAAQAATYTIPVVFHILHLGGSENISDAQVIDAVNILTRDFTRMNADTTDVVTPFTGKVGNPGIHFELAKRDPDGNCTNGIIRHWDPHTNWSGDQSDYAYSWPADQYLNIYVVSSLGWGAAAYTYLPGWVPADMDAIVTLHNYVGSIGTSSQHGSRVLTHEVGHWLNMEHTWGLTNNPGINCGDDGIFDTPLTMGFTSCSLNNAAICNPPIVENVQNYMDYSYCGRMFTHGQAFEMVNALNGSAGNRMNLSTTSNLALTGITNPGTQCITRMDLQVLPSATICSGAPLAFRSFTSNANPSGFSWTTNGSAQVTAPGSASTSITFNLPGNYTVTCTATGTAGNVTKDVKVTVLNGVADVNGHYTEGFEAGTQLPAPWADKGSPNGPWQVGSGASSQGSNCVHVPGGWPYGTEHLLESPSYDFKSNPGATFTFKYAYARAHSGLTDQFKVQASKDCGGTWSEVYVPGMNVLAKTSGSFSANFIPNASHWKLYVLTNHPAFISFLKEPHVQIRFYYREDSLNTQNQFYLDEINFTGTVGFPGLRLEHEMNLFPNPASAEVFVEFSDLNGAAEIQLYDVTGLLVRSAVCPAETGRLKLDLYGLSKGMYLLHANSPGRRSVKKLVVE
jgi:PKD repeat protein